MKADFDPTKRQNYAFLCEECGIYVLLADILPHFSDVGFGKPTAG